MFLELYYQHYAARCRGAYWIEYISLPYAIHMPELQERQELEQRLLADGFQCVVHENTHPVMYVNFTLKRFGRNIKACGASSINPILMTKAQFDNEIYAKYKKEPTFRRTLENNYFLSASIQINSTKQALNKFLLEKSCDVHLQNHLNETLNRLKKQLIETMDW